MTSIIATFHPSTTSSSPSPSDTDTTSPSPSSSSSSSLLSTKTITISLLAGGISAGVILVAIVFVLAACCVVKRKRRRRRETTKSSGELVRQQNRVGWTGREPSNIDRGKGRDDGMMVAFEMHGAVAGEDRHGQAGGSGHARRSMELIPAVEPVVVRERADSSWPRRDVELIPAEKTMPASWL